MYNELTIREARENDELLLLRWRNEKSVRETAFNMKVISREDHKKWFKKKIQDPNCLLLILKKEGRDIGQVRFDIHSSGESEVDVSIVSNERNKGYGEAILKMGADCLFRKYPDTKKAVSYVKKSNSSSIKAFLKAGFREVDQVGYKGHMAIKLVLDRK
jgi:RimJ/RimL family protein N-acetyltransferase